MDLVLSLDETATAYLLAPQISCTPAHPSSRRSPVDSHNHSSLLTKHKGRKDVRQADSVRSRPDRESGRFEAGSLRDVKEAYIYIHTVSQSSVRTRCELFELYPTTTPPGQGRMLTASLCSVQAKGISQSNTERGHILTLFTEMQTRMQEILPSRSQRTALHRGHS